MEYWSGALFAGVVFCLTAVPVSLAGEPAARATQVGEALLPQAVDVHARLSVPFTLASVPKKALFDMAFKVKTTGICEGVLYRPTQIWINGRSVASLNFRDNYEADELVKYRFEVPRRRLKAGENQMSIRMGSCMKGADSIRLNNLTLAGQEP